MELENIEYKCSPNVSSTGFTQLMTYVMMTGKKHILSENIIKVIQPELQHSIIKQVQTALIATMKELIIADPTILNKKNTKGWTALMLACRNSQTDSSESTVRMLIDAGADVNLQDNDEWTALMMAARYSRIDSSESTIRMLIDAGAKLNLKNIDGWTALITACICSKTDSTESTVRMLIDAGADLNIQNNDGWTALIMSCKFSKTDSTESTVRILIESGADLNIVNNEGKKASDYVMKNKIIDCYTDAIIVKQTIIVRKKINYEYTLKYIPSHSKMIKFKPGNMGYKITSINFKLMSQSATDIYPSIDNKILDYLSVLSSSDLVDKIKQYLSSQ